MSGISIEPYFPPTNDNLPGFLNQANRTSECNLTAFQNSVSEHSCEGDPASFII